MVGSKTIKSEWERTFKTAWIWDHRIDMMKNATHVCVVLGEGLS